MDFGVAVGAAGALIGVIIGGWLSDRSQRRMQQINILNENYKTREAAFTDFIAAYNQMRRLLISSPVKISLSKVPSGRQEPTPVIEGATPQWDALERANSRVLLISPDTEVDATAYAAMKDIFHLAYIRTSVGPGEVPQAVVDESARIIKAIVRAARRELEAGSWRGRATGQAERTSG